MQLGVNDTSLFLRFLRPWFINRDVCRTLIIVELVKSEDCNKSFALVPLQRGVFFAREMLLFILNCRVNILSGQTNEPKRGGIGPKTDARNGTKLLHNSF